YTFKINMLPKVNHFLDSETRVQTEISAHISDSIKYDFVDSQGTESFLIQISDVIVGIVWRLYEFIDQIDFHVIEEYYEKLNDVQKKTLYNLWCLIERSNALNPKLIYRIRNEIIEDKFKCLFNLVHRNHVLNLINEYDEDVIEFFNIVTDDDIDILIEYSNSIELRKIYDLGIALLDDIQAIASGGYLVDVSKVQQILVKISS
ncbi:MAG: hypothetical protein ACRCXK_07665, partial [Wohlfahrtiimonas sp.]